MTTQPVQISFRNMSVVPEIEEEIRSRVAWLESFYPRIVGCRVLLEAPHRHRRRPLHIRVELSLPGEDVVVNHEPALQTTARAPRVSNDRSGHHEDAYVVIREAFDIVRRRLQDVVRRRREDVDVPEIVT